MQQPKNPNTALQMVLKSFQEDIEQDNPHYKAAADKNSFRSGYANGVESASLYTLAVTLSLVTSGQEAGKNFIEILDMLETVHYAGHVLNGGSPRCAAVEKLMEEAALKAMVLEKFLGLRNILKTVAKSAPSEPPTTFN